MSGTALKRRDHEDGEGHIGRRLDRRDIYVVDTFQVPDEGNAGSESVIFEQCTGSRGRDRVDPITAMRLCSSGRNVIPFVLLYDALWDNLYLYQHTSLLP